MDVSALRQNTVGETPSQPVPDGVSPIDPETAIARSQRYLLSQQKPEGYWIGELMVDATLVADMIAYHHWDGKVDRAMAAQGGQSTLFDAVG